MSKTISANLKTHLEGESTTVAQRWKITLVQHQPRIDNITQANPGVVTTRWAHGYTTNDPVRLVDVVGMTEVNDLDFTVTVLSTTTFEIDRDTTSDTAYVSDGTAQKILGFTTNSADVIFGKVTYKAALGYQSTEIKSAGDLSVDNLDVLGTLDSTTITDADIAAGRYDFAEVEIALFNYNTLADGDMILRKGNLGEIVTKRDSFVGELRGMADFLQQRRVARYSVTCRVELRDTECGVRLEPPAWTATTAFTVRPAGDAKAGSVVRPTTENGRHFKCTTAGTSAGSEPSWDTVIGNTTADGSVVWTTIQGLTLTGTLTSVTDNSNFVDTSRTEADDFWTFGLLTFTSGNNIGIGLEVKDYVLSTGAFETYTAFPFTVAGSDAYEVHAGCDKIFTTCKTKFDNVKNFRGEPHIPGQDHILRYPDAK